MSDETAILSTGPSPTVAFRAPRNTAYDEEHLSSLEAHREWITDVSNLEVNQRTTSQRFYIAQHFRPKPGDRILDIGAYVGNNLLRYGGEGHPIDGIEIGSGYCGVWEARKGDLPADHPARFKAQMFCAAFEEWATTRTYDQALICEVLEHVIDPTSFVAKAAALLAPGGQLFIASPRERTRTAVREVTPADLRRWTQETGLEVSRLFVAVARKRNDGPRDWGVDQWICIATKEGNR